MARELLGYISVDSGVITIVDPFYLTKTKLDPADLRDMAAATVRGAKQVGSGSWKSAIIAATGTGDGIFPIYRDGEDIIIAFSEWLWDAEDGRGVRPFRSIWVTG